MLLVVELLHEVSRASSYRRERCHLLGVGRSHARPAGSPTAPLMHEEGAHLLGERLPDKVYPVGLRPLSITGRYR